MSLDAPFVPQRQTTSITGGARPLIYSFCCPAHSNPCLRMGRGRRSRPFALSIPRVLLAEGRRGHGNATAVRSQSEPAADEDRRAANNIFVCVEGHAPAARFLCVAALGRRQAAARQLASCSTRAPRSVPVPRSAGRPS